MDPTSTIRGKENAEARLAELVVEMGEAGTPDEAVQRINHLPARTQRLLRRIGARIVAARDEEAEANLEGAMNPGVHRYMERGGRARDLLNPMHARALIQSLFIGSQFHPDMTPAERQSAAIGAHRARVMEMGGPSTSGRAEGSRRSGSRRRKRRRRVRGAKRRTRRTRGRGRTRRDRARRSRR